MKKLIVIVFAMSIQLAKSETTLESLMQNFTNEYAFEHAELYNKELTEEEYQALLADTSIILLSSALGPEVFYHCRFADTDTLVNDLVIEIKKDFNQITPYFESNRHDLAMVILLNHIFDEVELTIHDRTPLRLKNKDRIYSYVYEFWTKRHRQISITTWLSYLKENGHISD